MARDKLGEPLRNQIISEYTSGVTQKDLCAKFGIHKSTISRLIARFKKTGSGNIEHKGGRKPKTSPRQDALVIRAIKKNPFISSRQLVETFELPITSRAVRYRAVKVGLKSFRPSKKPLISKKNMQKRLKFARDHLNWSVKMWKTVLFSDESKFNIIGSDGMQTVRRPTGKRLSSQYCRKTVKHGGGSIMVWGCFAYAGVGPLHLIEGIMKTQEYKSILSDVMLPYAEEEMPLRWSFQQDNDPKHTARATKQWFTDQKVTVMEWPPQSPDLNPIENLWDIVDRHIDRQEVRNKHQLFEQAKRAWDAIPLETIHNLIESMPRRCQAVIDSKGFATKY